MLTTLPPEPYTSGTMFAYLRRRFSFQPLPPPESVAGLPFARQVATGFEMALNGGFDVAGAGASRCPGRRPAPAGESCRRGRSTRG